MANDTDTVISNFFIFVCAVLVFFMHTGFAMLEAGGVQVILRSTFIKTSHSSFVDTPNTTTRENRMGRSQFC